MLVQKRETSTAADQVLTNNILYYEIFDPLIHPHLPNYQYLYPTLFISSANQQRSQKIFKAQTPMDLQQVRTKLQGFGMQLLDGIDPNPDNFVCAGIVHMRAQQVGCLLRLEPNKQAQVMTNFLINKQSIMHEIVGGYTVCDAFGTWVIEQLRTFIGEYY